MNKHDGYILEIGQGKGNSYGFNFPMSELLINPLYANKTIKQIAKSIAKMEKVKHGEIEIHGVTFAIFHRNPETIKKER